MEGHTFDNVIKIIAGKELFVINIMKSITTLCCIFCLSLFPALSHAQFKVPQAHERSALRVHAGYQGRYHRAEIAYESPTLWQTSAFNHPVDVKLEGSFALWHINGGRLNQNSRSTVWQIGLTPMLRWWVNPQWYVEAGAGVNFFSHTRFANQEFSTRLQFGEHIGIARTFGDDWRIGLRVSHFSNASIKEPNPGFNIFQLTLSHAF